MKKIWITAIMLTSFMATAFAQGPVDALRYSKTNPGGTARFMGLGGAFGALGADFTTASTNPAGIGLFKSSELAITPSVFIGSTESLFQGYTSTDQKSNFNLGHVGLVLANPIKAKKSGSAWKFAQFAIGINRLANYNNRMDIYGSNTSNSLLDAYAELGQGHTIEEIEDINGNYLFDLRQAWFTWLLDPDPDAETGFIGTAPTHGVIQAKNINSTGSMNEFVISFGANYNDRLYIGGTIGVPFIRYNEYSIYTESDLVPEDTLGDRFDFDHFNRIEDLATRGDGFNLKVGMIYRVSDWLRVGAAVHSPTWFTNMKDSWSTRMIAYWDEPVGGETIWDSEEALGSYTYDLVTPFRAQGSIGIIIGNVGLVSAEYEFTDFSMARLDSPDYNFRDENNAIKNSYGPAHTLRLGTEWRYNIFSFRIGGNYMSSPYQADINDGGRIGFAGGIGLRSEVFFADLAYAYSSTEEDYYLYSTETVFAPRAANTMNTHSVLLTMGVKF